MPSPVTPTVSFSNYIPPVHWFGDSIPYGVGCATLAGPREKVYNLAAASSDLYFVGTVSFAGAGGGLSADPYCDCVPGVLALNLNDLLFRMQTFNPRIVIYSAGINDIIDGQSAATVASRISTGLDTINGFRRYYNFRIVLTSILKTLNAANDVVVQATNALLPGVVSGKSYSSRIVYVPQIYASVSAANMSDDVHPDDTGANQYGQALWDNGLAGAVQACRGET